VFLAGNQRITERMVFDFLEVIPDTPMPKIFPVLRGVSGGGSFAFREPKEIPADSWFKNRGRYWLHFVLGKYPGGFSFLAGSWTPLDLCDPSWGDFVSGFARKRPASHDF